MTIKLNDKTYISNVPTFGILRKLEERGLNIKNIDDNMFSFISNYFSIMVGLTLDEIDNEISEHIKKYGADSLADLVNQAIEGLSLQGFSEVEKKSTKKTNTK